MKKKYLFKTLSTLFLSLFISLQSFAQLGTDVYTLGLDNSNNYGGSWVATSAGNGFGNWTFADNNNGTSIFAGRFITAAHQSGVDVSGNSFGMYANPSGASSTASRSLPKEMLEGDSFSIVVGVSYRNGQKGFRLRNSSNSPIITFEVSNDQYNLNGNNVFGPAHPYSENTVITFTFTQNATDVSWTAVRSGGLTDSQSGTISSISPSTITNLEMFITNTDGGGAAQNNLYFNSLVFTSKYTINNNSSVNVTSTTTAPYLQVESGSTVTVASSNALTVSGNLTNNGTVTLNSGSSLIVNGTSTGNVTYTRNLPTSNWYLVSSPVSGQAYNDSYVTENGIASSIINPTNRGIATYTNTDNTWSYLVSGGSGTFDNGKGYSVKRASAGDISFTGTINTANVSVAVSNGFNLVGNPFTASLNLGDFFVDNGAAGAISGAQTWFWNGSSYDVKTSGNHGTFEIAPGQGFFVNAAGGGNLTFNISSVSHATAVFQKTNPRPEITLTLTEGSDTRNAYIYYVNGTTIDYDLGYDGNLFGGVSHSLAVYSHLVNNDNGNKYQLQSLPDSNYENMVIPIGIIAAAGKEITFTAEALNLPNDLKVYLEDRLTNTVTRLDEANTSYKVTLNDALNGTGRFFLHTKASGVLSTDELDLSNTSVYATANNTLRVVGLPSGNATVKVFTVLGKQVVQTSFSSTGSYDVSLPKLATGMYIVQLETATGKLNKKIFLE